jgi:rhodanese-related sulfurtransferase
MNAHLLRGLVAATFSAALVLPVLAAQETPNTLDGVKTVTAEQVRDLGAKGAPLVDARAANEYAEKTIKGSISIPYKEKSAKAPDFDKSLDSFDLGKLKSDKASPVVFFCNAGNCWKSYKAASVARDAGFKQVYWFRGGFPEWEAKGLPTQ